MKTKLMERVFDAQAKRQDWALNQFEADIEAAILNGLLETDEYDIISDENGIDIYDNINNEITFVILTNKGFSLSSNKTKRFADEDNPESDESEKPTEESKPEESANEPKTEEEKPIDLSFDTKKDLIKLISLRKISDDPGICDIFYYWLDEYANMYYMDEEKNIPSVFNFMYDALDGSSDDEYINLEFITKELDKIGEDFVDKFVMAFMKFYKEDIIEKKKNLTVGGSESAYFLDKMRKKTERKLSVLNNISGVENLKHFSKKNQLILAKKLFSDVPENIDEPGKRQKFIDEINKYIDLNKIQQPLTQLITDLDSDNFKSDIIWEFFDHYKKTTVHKNFASYLKWTLTQIKRYKDDYNDGESPFLTNRESLEEVDYNIYTLNKVLDNYDKEFVTEFFNSYRKWDYEYPIKTYIDICNLKNSN